MFNMFLEERSQSNSMLPIISCQRISHISKQTKSTVNLLHHNVETQANISFNYLQTPNKKCDEDKPNGYELQFLFQKSNFCHTARKTSTPINSDEPLHVLSPLIPCEPNIYSEEIFLNMGKHSSFTKNDREMLDNAPAVTFRPLSSNTRRLPNILNVKDLEQLNAATKDVKFIPIYPKNDCINNKNMLDLSVTLNRNPIIEQYVSSAIEFKKAYDIKNIKQEKSVGSEPLHRKAKNKTTSLRVLESSHSLSLRKNKRKNLLCSSDKTYKKNKSSPIKMEMEDFSENVEIKMEPMTFEALEKVLSYEENHILMKIDALGRVVIKKEVASPDCEENSADFEGFEEKDFVIRKNLSNIYDVSDIFEDDKLQIDSNFDIGSKINTAAVEHEVTFTTLKNNYTFSDSEKNSLGYFDENDSKKDFFLKQSYETSVDYRQFSSNRNYLNSSVGREFENEPQSNENDNKQKCQTNQEALYFSDKLHIKDTSYKCLGMVQDHGIENTFNVSNGNLSQSLSDSNSSICIDLDSPTRPSVNNNHCLSIADKIPDDKFSCNAEISFGKSCDDSSDDVRIIEKSSLPSKYIYRRDGLSMQKVEVENSSKNKDLNNDVSIKHIKDTYSDGHILSSNGVTLRRVCDSIPEVWASDRSVTFKMIQQSNKLLPELNASSDISHNSSRSPDRSSNCSSISLQSKSLRMNDIWPRKDLEDIPISKLKNNLTKQNTLPSNFNASPPRSSDKFDNLTTTQRRIVNKNIRLFKKSRLDCFSAEDESNKNSKQLYETPDSNIPIIKVTKPTDPFLRKFSDHLPDTEVNIPSDKKIKENSLRFVRIRDKPMKEPFKLLMETAVDLNCLKSKSDCDKENKSTENISFRILDVSTKSENCQISSVRKSTSAKYKFSNSGYFTEVKKGVPKRYICPLCILVSNRKKDYFAHFNTYHREEDIFVCTVCHFKDTNKYKFNKHLNEHLSTIYKSFKVYEENRLINCNVCKFASILAIDFLIHKTIHIPKESFYNCGNCQMSYKIKEILDIHRCFLKEKSVRSGSSSYNYKKQIVDHDMKNLGPFECQYCPYASNKQKDVAYHELIHADPQSFICHYCSEDAGSLIKLADHLEIHKKRQAMEVNDKKQLICYICDTLFNDSSDLKLHLISHTIDFKSYRSKPKEKCSVRLNTKSNIPEVEINPKESTSKIPTKPVAATENMTYEPKSNFCASEGQADHRSLIGLVNTSSDDHSIIAKDYENNNIIVGKVKEAVFEQVGDEDCKEFNKPIIERILKDFKNVEGALNISCKSNSIYEIENIKPTDEKNLESAPSSTFDSNFEVSPNEASDRPLFNKLPMSNKNGEITIANPIREKEPIATKFEIKNNVISGVSSEIIMLNTESSNKNTCDRNKILDSEHDFSKISSGKMLKAQTDCSSFDVRVSDVVTDQLNTSPMKKLKTLEIPLILSPSSESNLLKIYDLQAHALKTNLEKNLIEKDFTSNLIVENIIEPMSVWNESKPIVIETKVKSNYPLGVVNVENSGKQFDCKETKTLGCLLGVVFEEPIAEEVGTFVQSSDSIEPLTNPNGSSQLNRSPKIKSENEPRDEKECSNDKHFDFPLTVCQSTESKKVAVESDMSVSCYLDKNSDISNKEEGLKHKIDPVMNSISLGTSSKMLLQDINVSNSPPSKFLLKNDDNSCGSKVTNLTDDFSNNKSNYINELYESPYMEIRKPPGDVSSNSSIGRQNHTFESTKDKENFHLNFDKCFTNSKIIKCFSSKNVTNEVASFSKASTSSVGSESFLNKVEKSQSIVDDFNNHQKRDLKKSKRPAFEENRKSKKSKLKVSESCERVSYPGSFNRDLAVRKTVHNLALQHINEDISQIIGKKDSEHPQMSSKNKEYTQKSKFKARSSFNDKGCPDGSKNRICTPRVLYSEKKKIDTNKIGSNRPKGMQKEVKKELHNDKHSRMKKKNSHHKQSETKGHKSHHSMKSYGDEKKKTRVEKNKLASTQYYAKQQEFILSLFNKKPLLKMGRIPKKKPLLLPRKEGLTEENEKIPNNDKLSIIRNPVSEGHNSDDFYYLSVAENKSDSNKELICTYKLKKQCDSKEQIHEGHQDYPQCIQEMKMESKNTSVFEDELSSLQKEKSSEGDRSKTSLENISHSLGNSSKEKNVSFSDGECVEANFVPEVNTRLFTPESVTSPNLSNAIGDIVTGLFGENFLSSHKSQLFQPDCEPVGHAAHLKLKECSMSDLQTLSKEIKLGSVETNVFSTEAKEYLQSDGDSKVEDFNVVKEFDTQVLEKINDEDTFVKESNININVSSEKLTKNVVRPDEIILESMKDPQEADCLINEKNVDLYDYIDKAVESLINNN